MSLAQHPYFQRFTDPVTGVESYLLDEVVAPIQQSFYFVNPSLTEDEKVLWMHGAFPPSPQKTLAAVSLDPENPWVRHFPQAQFPSAQPLIGRDGTVYFGSGKSIYRIDSGGQTERIFTLPDEVLEGRPLEKLATHLSLNADGRYLLLDFCNYARWSVGFLELATGRFEVEKEFTVCHNHAQFSPTDPKLYALAQDQYTDIKTGKFHHHTQRTHLLEMGADRYDCINPEHPCRPFHGACHEWWSPDGWLCYIDYELGGYEYHPQTREKHHVWKEPLCHAHCSRQREYWCADESPYYWQERPCKVLFYNRRSGQRHEIQSGMPAPGGDYWSQRKAYHIDPHPQFSPRDTYVVYTAVDPSHRPTVALCPTGPLI